LDAQQLRVAAGTCAYAKKKLQFAEIHTKSAFVFATHCDQLRRAFDCIPVHASDRVFLFNLPATCQTSVARKMISAELKRLGNFLVQLGGRTPIDEALARTMADYEATRRELAAAAEWCPGSAYARALAQFHLAGSVSLPPVGMGAGSSNKRESSRLAIIGGPFGPGDWPLLDAIESLGGAIVVNATETGERTVGPPIPVRTSSASSLTGSPAPLAENVRERESQRAEPDDRVMALAERVLERCIDVFQRPNTRLYAWLKQRLVERKVEALILWHYVGCDLWRAEAESLREAFKLPLLLLEADESGSCSPRNLGRVQAFLEALR
jgi:benzoyl-CoA reductase/2-hydroxyglutaryl-CoA dehydratase subunit BcrC/BadD/HgdB